MKDSDVFPFSKKDGKKKNKKKEEKIIDPDNGPASLGPHLEDLLENNLTRDVDFQKTVDPIMPSVDDSLETIPSVSDKTDSLRSESIEITREEYEDFFQEHGPWPEETERTRKEREEAEAALAKDLTEWTKNKEQTIKDDKDTIFISKILWNSTTCEKSKKRYLKHYYESILNEAKDPGFDSGFLKELIDFLSKHKYMKKLHSELVNAYEKIKEPVERKGNFDDGKYHSTEDRGRDEKEEAKKAVIDQIVLLQTKTSDVVDNSCLSSLLNDISKNDYSKFVIDANYFEKHRSKSQEFLKLKEALARLGEIDPQWALEKKSKHVAWKETSKLEEQKGEDSSPDPVVPENEPLIEVEKPAWYAPLLTVFSKFFNWVGNLFSDVKKFDGYPPKEQELNPVSEFSCAKKSEVHLESVLNPGGAYMPSGGPSEPGTSSEGDWASLLDHNLGSTGGDGPSKKNSRPGSGSAV